MKIEAGSVCKGVEMSKNDVIRPLREFPQSIAAEAVNFLKVLYFLDSGAIVWYIVDREVRR